MDHQGFFGPVGSNRRRSHTRIKARSSRRTMAYIGFRLGGRAVFNLSMRSVRCTWSEHMGYSDRRCCSKFMQLEAPRVWQRIWVT